MSRIDGTRTLMTCLNHPIKNRQQTSYANMEDAVYRLSISKSVGFDVGVPFRRCYFVPHVKETPPRRSLVPAFNSLVYLPPNCATATVSLHRLVRIQQNTNSRLRDTMLTRLVIAGVSWALLRDELGATRTITDEPVNKPFHIFRPAKNPFACT